MEFTDKVVIVTGASSGIGRATALAFAEHGCLLTITGRNMENLNDVSSLCKNKGAKDVVIVKAEFKNLEDVDSIVHVTVEKYKKIDVLVNNAGINVMENLENMKITNFDLLFQVNVKSMLRITQLAMPYLVQSKGNIVNVSSYLADKHVPKFLLLGMTKAAISQLTKTTALEYAPKGVRVNAICPNTVMTGVARDRFKTREEFEKYYEDVAAGTPLGRIGKVEECSHAILFLASSKSAWTTGQCLVLDGGRGLMS